MKQYWKEAVERSLAHWKDNLKKLQAVSEEDWEDWVKKPNLWVRDSLNGIHISGDYCDCCRFIHSPACDFRCPLEDTEGAAEEDLEEDSCWACCKEWQRVCKDYITNPTTREKLEESMKKMIKRLEAEACGC